MWIPIKLIVKRLGSHIDTTFPFVEGQVRLITGENGSGKSIITEGISIALLGTIIRKDTTISDLINDNYDDAEVELTMRNTMTHVEMIINRKFSRTSSQKLSLKVDNEEKKLGGVTPTEDHIFSLIGITKSDVLNYFIVHKDKYLSFFGSSDTIKKQVIGRFSGASLITDVFKDIEADIFAINNIIGTIEKDINRSQGMIEAYQEQLNQLKNDYNPEKERADSIKTLENLNISRQEKIKEYDLTHSQLEEEHSFYWNRINLWEAKVNGLIFPHTETLKELLEAKEVANSVFKEYEKKIKELNEEKTHLELLLAGEIECPNCHTKFILSEDELDLDKMKEGLTEIEKELESIFANKTECENDLVEIEKEIGFFSHKESQFKRVISSYREEMIPFQKRKVRSLLSDIEENSKSKVSIQTSIATTKLEIEKLKEQPFINKKEETDKKIENIKIDIKAFESDKLLKEKDLELSKEWIEYYKSFISFLSNKAIKNIEGYTNLHLNKFKSDLQVLIEGYKELKKSEEIREEITTHVVRNGKKVPFGRHSNGQRTRISLANIFALQKLINATASSGGLGYCILDEIIESIDAKGVKGIVNTLKSLDLTIDIITHVNSEISGIPMIEMKLVNDTTQMNIR